MKNKDFVLSIFINAFLGYLWILFHNHINSIDNPLIALIGICSGTWLFWEIIHRVTPFNEYKNRHPVKIAGFVSIGIVLTVNLFVSLV
ncbi:hypothetical protein QNH20_25220 [Neobacillus sp. WH10]|uniref:hypothetical protein n=1 Tax=Neobacillus sp. WH10 TaxID=3047873 RepID=UPI0024C1C840|nr:hypothetical protein [Neobacillus sp. WH10]WHY77334.1 hypothetical protein QNH20_25220 [Neobacillus sp. WH10]